MIEKLFSFFKPSHWGSPKFRGHWFVFCAVVSAMLLVGALFFEHVIGLEPCLMCYWQRSAHRFIIAIAILALLVRVVAKSSRFDRLFLIALIIALGNSFYLGAWHTGFENGWWEGPKSCMAGPVGDIDPTDIMNAISGKTKAVACDDVQWRFLGISMAGYNSIISAFLALISTASLLKGRKA